MALLEGLLPGRVETCGLWAVVSRGRWRLEHAGRAIAVDTGHADPSFFLPGLPDYEKTTAGTFAVLLGVMVAEGGHYMYIAA